MWILPQKKSNQLLTVFAKAKEQMHEKINNKDPSLLGGKKKKAKK